MEKNKKIFVISPIGKKDSSGKDYTQIFLDHIVIPAAKEVGGYSEPDRADRMMQAGPITDQIITAIVESDVCVADITDDNPNVMYEIAIAHAADKSVILLKQEGGGGSFDIKDERTIPYGIVADEAHQAKEILKGYLAEEHKIRSESLSRSLSPVRAVFREMFRAEKERDVTKDEVSASILERMDRIEDALKFINPKLENNHANRVSTQSDLQVSEAIRVISECFRAVINCGESIPESMKSADTKDRLEEAKRSLEFALFNIEMNRNPALVGKVEPLEKETFILSGLARGTAGMTANEYVRQIDESLNRVIDYVKFILI